MAEVIVALGDAGRASVLLYKVQAGVQTQLAAGALTISSPPSQDGSAVAKVGDFSWTLERSMPCLRSDDHTYTFAITTPDAPAAFYCVILPKEVGDADLELLQSVLASFTAYSGGAAAAPPLPTAGDGAEALGVPVSSPQQQQQRGAPGAEAEGGAQQGQGPLPEPLLKGAAFLSSSFKWATGAASAGINAARERAEASMTPETKARLESAKQSAWQKLETVGRVSGKVVTDVRESANKLANRVAESDLAKSESMRNASRVVREVSSNVYRDMQKVGDKVVETVKEAAAKVRTQHGPGDAASGPSSAGSGPSAAASAGSSAAHDGGFTAAAAAAHAGGEEAHGAPVTGVPVSAPPAQGLPVSGTYPVVPPSGASTAYPPVAPIT